MEHIIIPTLGRMDKQITYNNLPKKYQKKVTFVVQAHELEEMKKRYGSAVIGLPDNINRIAPTREWIFNKFRKYRHMVFDDDLLFVVKEPNPNEGTKWLTRKFTEQDFDNAFDLINQWMDEGFVYGGLLPGSNVPDLKYWPYMDCQRVVTNVFYNGPMVPDDIEWDRCAAAEDLDVHLQLLTRGYKNRVSVKYMVSTSETNADGGCSTWRTVEVHNEAQRKLAKLWPNFVTLREKKLTNGPWKGHVKLRTIIQHKKAYESSQTNSLENFFE